MLDTHDEDERIEQLHARLTEMTKRAQSVPKDSLESLHISKMLDDIVDALRKALRAQASPHHRAYRAQYARKDNKLH